VTSFLALEASTSICSVSLSTQKLCEHRFSDEPRSHSRTLLAFIDELLTENNLESSDLDFIACSQGPGSFTGLRIGFSIAQSLAFGVSIPMVLVGTLENLANVYFSSAELAPLNVVTIMDARMNQVYWAAYQNQSNVISEIQKPRLISVEEAKVLTLELARKDDADKVSIVGDGASHFSKDSEFKRYLLVDDLLPDATTLSRLALSKWEKTEYFTAENAELIYLRDNISWKKRTKIRHQ